jgi:hypothetical protein
LELHLPCRRLSPVQSNIAGVNDMMQAGQTSIAASRHRMCFVVLACALLGFAPRTEASPFVINLLSSGSSGGAGGSSNGSSNNTGMSHLGLNVGGVLGQASNSSGVSSGSGVSPAGQANLNVGMALAAPASGSVASLVAAVKSAVGGTAVSGSLARLDVGNGEYLSVSGAVSETLVSSVSPGLSSTSDGVSSTHAGVDGAFAPSQPATVSVANDVTNGGNGAQNQAPNDSYAFQSSLENASINDSVKAALGDIASGIISSPVEITNSSLGGASAVAEDPVHAPEPATLVLLASALAFAAHRLRRSRT